jgi:hypothetical protein
LAIVFGLLISLENNSSESQENGVNIEEARAILITLEREMREVEQKIRESREQLHSFLRWKKIKYNPHDNQSVVLFRQIHSREKLEYPYAAIGAELKFVQSLSRDENSLLTESVYQNRGHGEDYVSHVLKNNSFCSLLQGECKRHKCNRCVFVTASDRESCGRCMTKIEEIQASIEMTTTSTVRNWALFVSSRNLKNACGNDDLGDYSEDEVESMNLSSSSKKCIHLHYFIQEPLPKPTFCQRFWAIVSYFRGNSQDSVYFSDVDSSSKVFESRNLRPGILKLNSGLTDVFLLGSESFDLIGSNNARPEPWLGAQPRWRPLQYCPVFSFQKTNKPR